MLHLCSSAGVAASTAQLQLPPPVFKRPFPLLFQTGTGYAEVWLQRPEWWAPSWGYEDGFEEEAQRRAA